VERLSASSADLSPEFSLGSLDDTASGSLSRSRLGSGTVSDAEDADCCAGVVPSSSSSLVSRLNRSFSSWNLLPRSSSIGTDSSEDLASLAGHDASAADLSDDLCSTLLFRQVRLGPITFGFISSFSLIFH